jgi:hypothetical protein
MCVAVQFVVEGKTRTAHSGVLGASLPVLTRSGQVRWVEWGAPAMQQIASSESPGHIMKLPVGNWVDLAALRNGDWVRYRPRPVRIVAIAFGVYLEPRGSPGFPLERWIPLGPGEYLQGALAKVYAEQRVYVVTVPPPAEYERAQPCWPRIINAMYLQGSAREALRE